MYAQFFQDLPGIGKDVNQMADGRALVSANIGYARLQQGLGNREDALAMEFFAVPQAQHLYFLCE